MKKQRMQQRQDHSTYSVVTQVTAEKNSEKLAKAKKELQALHLTQALEQRFVDMLSQNSAFITRILSLVKKLIEFDIPLTETNLKLIESNINKSGYISNLLSSLSEKGIDSKFIPFTMVCDAARHFDHILLSLSFFTGNKKLDLRTVFLLCTLPDHAVDLSKFVIALQNRGYPDSSIEKIINVLRIAASDQNKSRELMPQIIELLSLLLDKGLFYPECVDIVLGMGEKVIQVLEGAKELNLHNCLSSAYLEIVKSNLDNARFFAKNIALLSKDGFVDIHSNESLSRINECEEGAFYLFRQLSLKGLLNTKTFETVLAHPAVLRDTRVAAAFKGIPFLDTLCPGELQGIIKSLGNPSTDAAVAGIVDYLDVHKLDNCPSGMAVGHS